MGDGVAEGDGRRRRRIIFRDGDNDVKDSSFEGRVCGTSQVSVPQEEVAVDRGGMDEGDGMGMELLVVLHEALDGKDLGLVELLFPASSLGRVDGEGIKVVGVNLVGR